MIIKVKINEQIFQVEISDLQSRPIIAIVDGDEFEIWPEGEPARDIQDLDAREASLQVTTRDAPLLTSPAPKELAQNHSPQPSGITPPAGSDSLKVVRAPIPGVITAVDVHVGSEVSVGQQLCVLEAMKMNNSIRAVHAGTIAAVHISIGQHVKHHDVLIEFAG